MRVVCCALILSSAAACGSDARSLPDSGLAVDASTGPAPPCPDYNANNNVYWGDLHTHTALSADAYEWGNRNFPIDAYRFASNPAATVGIGAGMRTPGPTVSIDRALDFDAVTDHSEWMDAVWACGRTPSGQLFDPASIFGSSAQCTTFRADENGSLAKTLQDATAVVQLVCDGGLEDDPRCHAFTASAWQIERQAAHDAYQRCRFTTFVAYEWSHSSAHQNVIFGSESVPSAPFDAFDYPSSGELWSALAASCTSANGCSVLTIPHNPNLSGGASFELPSGVAALQQMNRYQRLVEIYQNKGNSECYPGSGSTDPACAFEQFQPDEPARAFVRSGLERGLKTFASYGVNALQLGIIAATDDHNGLPGYVKEDTWQGHAGAMDDTPLKRLRIPTRSPGGITGVWAPQNTREDIYAALYRRETFGTSGPRIAVRFYQVWGASNYCTGAFPGNALAAGAVPMGGTMSSPPSTGAAPQFVVSALEDTEALAEVDIIKATYVNGAVQESIKRFTPASPNTTWSNGSVCLGWIDGAFTPAAPTLYYARVLQVPTWRWSHYDCLALPTTTGCESGGPLDVKIQERAWTSPIWWAP